ncbi:putative HAD superfamily hydrolase [Aulographum hederae CBS 113979]|uniref:Putative HAD superfamily hydrolase n=1 Tax=Aulographum hederae CBS 113979 TaxID=1176131 RepID=A0A6G1GSE6_9PEZI|nr:putative HAD superfamily hydrolase [Aulographum hederae CBS 113979]
MASTVSLPETLICSIRIQLRRPQCRPIPLPRKPLRRYLQTSPPTSRIPSFAFAFDIDGVLVRSSDPLPRAHETLSYLQRNHIPFILLTNGGGKTEAERIEELSHKLGVELDTSMFVQSHTPFALMDEYKDKTVLVVGGDGDKCRHVAESYGYKNVVTPGDILVAHPEIWPFAQQFLPYYKPITRPLPSSISATHPTSSLKIDAIFVYNDPRDWGLDATIILDLLLSSHGILGTTSLRNNDDSLRKRGFQQDNQPTLFYSNPDLWWAAKYHLPRLGQGGFREALEGLWRAVTDGAELKKTVIGKPHQLTYEFAERRLREHRQHLFGGEEGELTRVFMVGDNPESDIRGANEYKSPWNSRWTSCLVRTGVYAGGVPRWTPEVTVEGVEEAVKWAIKDVGWEGEKK